MQRLEHRDARITMPDDPHNADSLGDDPTFVGEEDTPGESEQSLGDQPTTGDALSSPSDLSDLADDLGDQMPLVDLSERYEIQGPLGKGGMGEVFRALDTRLQRQVAIKRVHGEMAGSAKALSRFLTEAQSIAQLDHENIVDIYDYGRDAEGPFLIMQFIGGGSLLDRCREGPLPLEEAIEITCLVCDALQMAHSRGVIHRDIKPANILLTEEGIPKLTDFGLARQESVDHGQTQAGVILGTIDFMPPEQRQDATAVEPRSDLWSLAATLYQMVTGKSPKVIRLRDVPPQLQDIVSKGLEEEQEDRYQSATEFRDALRASLRSVDPETESGSALEKGICPSCQTKNDDSRRFCSNPDCAESLRVNCLGCEQEIPIWEVICGQCGENQTDLYLSRCTELEDKRDKAITLRSEFAFVESIELAREISQVSNSRLQHLKEWAETFIKSAEEESLRKQRKAEESYSEAQQHRQEFDYHSAIRTLEAIPEQVLSNEMSAYLEWLRSDRSELKDLLEQIKDRIDKRELEDLLPLVNRALELQGNRQDLHKLHDQLLVRETKIARKRLEDQRLVEEKEELLPPFIKDDFVEEVVVEQTDQEAEARKKEAIAKAIALFEEGDKTNDDDDEVGGFAGLLMIVGFIAITWIHFALGGWITLQVVTFLGVILFLQDFIASKDAEERFSDAMAMFSIPFICWGIIAIVGWVVTLF